VVVDNENTTAGGSNHRWSLEAGQWRA
jgi:hypothetical protein